MTLLVRVCATLPLLLLVAGCSDGEEPRGGDDDGGTGGADIGTGGSTASGGVSENGGLPQAGDGGAPMGEGNPCEGLLLCDDFESGMIDTSLWSVETNNGNTMEIVTDQAANGTHSLHIHANNGYARLRNESVFPMPNNDYFGRMYLRVAKFSTVNWAHWTVGEGAGVGDGSMIRVGGQYNSNAAANRWGVGTDGGPTGDWTMHDNDPPGSPMEPPENTWVCIEWEHKGSVNETRFFIEGEEHPSLATTSTSHGSNVAGSEYVLPEMTSFWFGWWQYQADDTMPFDVWIDLVALDDERIGCLN